MVTSDKWHLLHWDDEILELHKGYVRFTLTNQYERDYRGPHVHSIQVFDSYEEAYALYCILNDWHPTKAWRWVSQYGCGWHTGTDITNQRGGTKSR